MIVTEILVCLLMGIVAVASFVAAEGVRRSRRRQRQRLDEAVERGELPTG